MLQSIIVFQYNNCNFKYYLEIIGKNKNVYYVILNNILNNINILNNMLLLLGQVGNGIKSYNISMLIAHVIL